MHRQRLGALAASLLLLASMSPAVAQSGAGKSESVIVLAGGCFWGVEAVFEHVFGVRSVTSGFARPSDAERGFVPVEAVRIVYDPSRVKPDQLLTVFFTVAHDPTSRDSQGPDEGPEYRAMVFYQTPPERAQAESFFAGFAREKSLHGSIVTELRALGRFTEAEAFHQDFGAKHPTDPYVVRNDLPKLRALEAEFPSLYRPERSP
jgi:peptide-methionine (S)-S-oxide reductase